MQFYEFSLSMRPYEATEAGIKDGRLSATVDGGKEVSERMKNTSS